MLQGPGAAKLWSDEVCWGVPSASVTHATADLPFCTRTCAAQHTLHGRLCTPGHAQGGKCHAVGAVSLLWHGVSHAMLQRRRRVFCMPLLPLWPSAHAMEPASHFCPSPVVWALVPRRRAGLSSTSWPCCATCATSTPATACCSWDTAWGQVGAAAAGATDSLPTC